MKRRELSIGEEWISEDTLALLSIPEPLRFELSQYEALVRHNEVLVRHISASRVPAIARVVESHNIAHKDRLRSNELEEILAKVDALEARVAELESEREILPTKDHKQPKTALGWVLSHPELRLRYAGQYVAFTAAFPFEVIASNANLDDLLDSLGDDLSSIYIHQFS